MRPKNNARRLLGITRAKAKMWEYNVSELDHIRIEENPAKLFDLAVGSLGDMAASINGEDYFTDEQSDDLRANLKFSSQFFDSYHASLLDKSLDQFTALCASACYYLCDMPGSSNVLANQLGFEMLDLKASGLERLLLWLLQNKCENRPDIVTGSFSNATVELIHNYFVFYNSGKKSERIIEIAKELRRLAYDSGNPSELLFADTVCAVLRKRIEYSAWTCLPRFSRLSANKWVDAIQKSIKIRELWPSQRLLGEKGVLSGASAVIQMPSSAGKTKATELIIRSAFLSQRTSLAVIVAPFRALCHEIHDSLSAAFKGENISVNEPSDVMQQDLIPGLMTLLNRQHVIIITPEKLHYILRHEPDIACNIGLAIYDEGHLFDDPGRGVNYELLLSFIKARLPQDSQTVLISAVIGNTDQISNWLLGNEGIAISSMDLNITFRSVAFASWTYELGQLGFPTIKDIQDYSFIVPRVLKTHTLAGGKVTFPKKNANEISLYLALTLAKNGGIAMFCGRKDTAAAICRTAVKVYEKGLNIPSPINFSDTSEINKIAYLVEKNLGPTSEVKKSAELGILAHHGDIPHGVRLAVEYAIQQDAAKVVVCTSTLAQGVNLPIRYLIVTSVYQGPNPIKNRDFHNLIGRAGRAGKHTEGTIIFADHRILNRSYKWLRQQASTLLDSTSIEDCSSAILEIFHPIYNDRRNDHFNIKPLELVKIFLEGELPFQDMVRNIVDTPGYTEQRVKMQLHSRLIAIRSIQSYLLAHSEEWDDNPQGLDDLVEGTLAYTLADEEVKQNLKELFTLLRDNIKETVPHIKKRHVYGRSLFGLKENVMIDIWVSQNLITIQASTEEEELLTNLWTVVQELISNKSFRTCNFPDVLESVALMWISGKAFYQIFQEHLSDSRIGRLHCNIRHVVDLCENGLGYDGTLVIGAVAELLDLYEGDNITLKERIYRLQKRLRYGLPSQLDVSIFELGFADRVIAQEIARIIRPSEAIKSDVITALREKKEEVYNLLGEYPAYYRMQAQNIIGT